MVKPKTREKSTASTASETTVVEAPDQEKEELKARIAELEESTGLGEGEVPLPVKIANWLTISTGRKVLASEIRSAEAKRDRVVYSRKGDPTLYGIYVKEFDTEDLRDPPVHEHNIQVRVSGEQPACSCGKSK